MKHKFQIFTLSRNSHGVSIIVKHLHEAMAAAGLDVEIVHDLSSLDFNCTIIPYGIKESFILVRKGYPVEYAFLADAESLGYRNKVLFYLRHFIWGHGDLMHSLKNYFKMRTAEQYILPRVKNCILVSRRDIEYYKRIAPKTNYLFLPNGVAPSPVLKKTPSHNIRLGILSGWEAIGRAAENEWFVRDYFIRAKKSGLPVEMKIAGRGKYIELFRQYPDVEIIGEVADLNTFFADIDILVLPTPKGCGILNKALDGFSHRTFVAGHPAAFSGLQMFQGTFSTFSDYDGFVDLIDRYGKEPQKIQKMIDDAYEIVKTQCNWDTIYGRFVQELDKGTDK
ncbi:MAG: glycosyltransferase family 4 protein [Lentisphaerae bacterium]|nr:glycosyltransferase family 4 protein [Lentisphaerota bacterium]